VDSLEKQVRDNIVEIIRVPHSKAYIAASVLCRKNNLSLAYISAESGTANNFLTVNYTSPGNIVSTCNIEVDDARWKDVVYIRIGRKRKAFRLVKISDPSGVKDANGFIIKVLKKDILRDIGFQKALFTKIINHLIFEVKYDVEDAGERIKANKEKNDIMIQFPNWDVESRYSSGWCIRHKTKEIRIELTKELDIETIHIPTEKFACYPDEIFIDNLLGLFEVRPDLTT
jgi:hypothetical protein